MWSISVLQVNSSVKNVKKIMIEQKYRFMLTLNSENVAFDLHMKHLSNTLDPGGRRRGTAASFSGGAGDVWVVSGEVLVLAHSGG